MTCPNRTHIAVVLDRSWSMMAVRSETIGGFNQFVQDQKKQPGEATLTLVQFSDEVDPVFHCRLDRVITPAASGAWPGIAPDAGWYCHAPLESVRPLTPETYKPHGNTALLDAIAYTIRNTGDVLVAKPEAERPSKVITVIITDGQENVSRMYSAHHGGRADVFAMIEHQRSRYAWEFVFMGANQDAIATAESMGIAPGNALHYAATGRGMTEAFGRATRGMASYRSGSTPLTANFFDPKGGGSES